MQLLKLQMPKLAALGSVDCLYGLVYLSHKPPVYDYADFPMIIWAKNPGAGLAWLAFVSITPWLRRVKADAIRELRRGSISSAANRICVKVEYESVYHHVSQLNNSQTRFPARWLLRAGEWSCWNCSPRGLAISAHGRHA